MKPHSVFWSSTAKSAKWETAATTDDPMMDDASGIQASADLHTATLESPAAGAPSLGIFSVAGSEN